jgi:3-oxoacyl-[acyl-carrier protein] reductase
VEGDSNLRLKGKVCVVTGSGASIGRAIAQKMALEGAKVVVCDIDQAALHETEGAIAESNGAVLAFKVDVTKSDEIEAMIESIVGSWGHIDCLVANAGIVQDNQLEKMTDDQWDRVIDVNLKGVFLCARAVSKVMIRRKSGCILVTSSIAGLYGNFGQTNYAASKAAVIGMVKTWGKELGRHGVRAVAVCPGFIDTAILASMPEKVIETMRQRIPLKRLGTPEEIANVFAFLASDEASYVNGVAIEVGGGLVA